MGSGQHKAVEEQIQEEIVRPKIATSRLRSLARTLCYKGPKYMGLSKLKRHDLENILYGPHLEDHDTRVLVKMAVEHGIHSQRSSRHHIIKALREKMFEETFARFQISDAELSELKSEYQEPIMHVKRNEIIKKIIELELGCPVWHPYPDVHSDHQLYTF